MMGASYATDVSFAFSQRTQHLDRWSSGVGCLAFVPPTRAEQDALGNNPFVQTQMILAQMRVARLVVHFAPERAANMLSNASNGEISPELAGMILRQIASGPFTAPVEMETASPQRRSAGGAKFVTVDN